MSRPKSALKSIEIAVIVIVFIIAGLMVGDRRMPRHQIHGYPLAPSYAPGETAVFVWEFEMRRDCSGWTTRRLIFADRTVDLPSLEWPPRGLPRSELPRFIPLRIEVPLPDDVEPGMAYYDITGHYICNPLHRLWPISVDFPVIPFVVRAPWPTAPRR